MKIIELDDNWIKKYDEFLLVSEDASFWLSNHYRIILKNILNSEDHYFLLIDHKDQILGILPTFLKRNDKLGNVLNSLPFFGTHGSVCSQNKETEIKERLLDHFHAFAKKESCITSTVITTPLEEDLQFYNDYFKTSLVSSRVGQYSAIPKYSESIREDLMTNYKSTVRTCIRKAEKSGIKVTEGENAKGMRFLMETHFQNMDLIAGLKKPKNFFTEAFNVLDYGRDYRLFIATQNEQMIAGLLLFYFNKTVEYFIPVIDSEFRDTRALNLVIFEAMQNASQNQYLWWNWGGPGPSIKSLYDFKKRWGAEDKPYYYFTTIYSEKIWERTQEEILKEYPFFYVIPFEDLNQAKIEQENNEEVQTKK